MKKKLFVGLLTSLVLVSSPLSIAKKNIVINDLSKPILFDKKTKYFSIKMKSNPTTGYNWFLKSYDDKFISPNSYTYVKGENLNNVNKELDNNTTEKDLNINKMLGQSGYALFRFKVDSDFFKVPQTTEIEFVYKKSWELSSNETTKKVIINSYYVK